jgi:hypothetical protein
MSTVPSTSTPPVELRASSPVDFCNLITLERSGATRVIARRFFARKIPQQLLRFSHDDVVANRAPSHRGKTPLNPERTLFSAPHALQLYLRYLTETFVVVLNVSSAKFFAKKFSTRTKILC